VNQESVRWYLNTDEPGVFFTLNLVKILAVNVGIALFISLSFSIFWWIDDYQEYATWQAVAGNVCPSDHLDFKSACRDGSEIRDVILDEQYPFELVRGQREWLDELIRDSELDTGADHTSLEDREWVVSVAKSGVVPDDMIEPPFEANNGWGLFIFSMKTGVISTLFYLAFVCMFLFFQHSITRTRYAVVRQRIASSLDSDLLGIFNIAHLKLRRLRDLASSSTKVDELTEVQKTAQQLTTELIELVVIQMSRDEESRVHQVSVLSSDLSEVSDDVHRLLHVARASAEAEKVHAEADDAPDGAVPSS